MTIIDVAKRAGVSVTTVSRVITGAPHVSSQRLTAVQEAISELGYVPSRAARALVRRRSDVIAIITANTSIYGYAQTILGIERAARRASYTVMITVVESADEAEAADMIASTLSEGVAGAAVLTFDAMGMAALAGLPPSLPVVAICGLPAPGVSQVVFEEEDLATELVEHLLDLGHRTVHHIAIPVSGREDARTTGWRRALYRRGAVVPPIWGAAWEPDSAREIGRRLLRDDPSITAVFCGNDELAMGLIRGLIDDGWTVPGDVSVVGFDDQPLARIWAPSLTTVRQDFAALGELAFDRLLGTIEGRATGVSSLRPTLVVRESSAPARAS